MHKLRLTIVYVVEDETCGGALINAVLPVRVVLDSDFFGLTRLHMKIQVIQF